MRRKDRIALRSIEKRTRKLNQQFAELREAARRDKKDPIYLSELDREHHEERGYLNNERRHLVTDAILFEAYRLEVPVPPRVEGELWDTTWSTYHLVLTTKGLAQLRDMIREEKKKRREAWMWVVDVITKVLALLIGAGGIYIGILNAKKTNSKDTGAAPVATQPEIPKPALAAGKP